MPGPRSQQNIPTTSADEVRQQLERLIRAINERFPDLADPYDPDWRSACETAAPRPNASGSLEVPWQPLPRAPRDGETLFLPLERGLELSVHEDIKAYYGSFYSGGLEADSAEGPVSLLQLWNDEDGTRLMENLLGHALAKQRAKAPYSVFFACTEVDSEMFLSIENHTGHVLLERPGYQPERTLAGSLAEFLTTLTPAPPERHPERSAFLAQRGVN